MFFSLISLSLSVSLIIFLAILAQCACIVQASAMTTVGLAAGNDFLASCSATAPGPVALSTQANYWPQSFEDIRQIATNSFSKGSGSFGTRYMLLANNGSVFVPAASSATAAGACQQDTSSVYSGAAAPILKGEMGQLGAIEIGITAWNTWLLASNGSVFGCGSTTASGWGVTVTGSFSSSQGLTYSSPVLVNVCEKDPSFASQKIKRLVTGVEHLMMLSASGRIYSIFDYHINSTSSTVQYMDQFSSEIAVDMAAGYRFSLVLMQSGKIYSWGANEFGELNQGQQPYANPSNAPVTEVSTNGALAGKAISSISASWYASYFVTAQGELLMAGRGPFLGQGYTSELDSQYLAIKVNTGALSGVSVVQVVGSQCGSVAVTDQGGLIAWGCTSDATICTLGLPKRSDSGTTTYGYPFPTEVPLAESMSARSVVMDDKNYFVLATSCQNGMYGKNCDSAVPIRHPPYYPVYCFGVSQGDTAHVCNGHGTCVSNDTCTNCTGSFTGSMCNECDGKVLGFGIECIPGSFGSDALSLVGKVVAGVVVPLGVIFIGIVLSIIIISIFCVIKKRRAADIRNYALATAQKLQKEETQTQLEDIVIHNETFADQQEQFIKQINSIIQSFDDGAYQMMSQQVDDMQKRCAAAELQQLPSPSDGFIRIVRLLERENLTQLDRQLMMRLVRLIHELARLSFIEKLRNNSAYPSALKQSIQTSVHNLVLYMKRSAPEESLSLMDTDLELRCELECILQALTRVSDSTSLGDKLLSVSANVAARNIGALLKKLITDVSISVPNTWYYRYMLIKHHATQALSPEESQSAAAAADAFAELLRIPKDNSENWHVIYVLISELARIAKSVNIDSNTRIAAVEGIAKYIGYQKASSSAKKRSGSKHGRKVRTKVAVELVSLASSQDTAVLSSGIDSIAQRYLFLMRVHEQDAKIKQFIDLVIRRHQSKQNINRAAMIEAEKLAKKQLDEEWAVLETEKAALFELRESIRGRQNELGAKRYQLQQIEQKLNFIKCSEQYQEALVELNKAEKDLQQLDKEASYEFEEDRKRLCTNKRLEIDERIMNLKQRIFGAVHLQKQVDELTADCDSLQQAIAYDEGKVVDLTSDVAEKTRELLTKNESFHQLQQDYELSLQLHSEEVAQKNALLSAAATAADSGASAAASSASPASPDDVDSSTALLNDDEEIPNGLLCPITMELMEDPVLLIESGYSYERKAILRWLEQHGTDPLSGVAIEDKTIVPNKNLKKNIEEWKEQQQRRKKKQIQSQIRPVHQGQVTNLNQNQQNQRFHRYNNLSI